MNQSRKKRRRIWLWIVGSVIGLYLLWCILTPICWTTTSTQQYSGGIKIHTVAMHELCAYWGMEGIIIPFPLYHVNEEYQKIIFLDGKNWLTIDGLDRVYPSPAGRYLVVQYFSKGPIRVTNTLTRNSIDVLVPDSKKEFPDHYCEYPFEFLRWTDEKNFLVEVTGIDFDHEAKDYRQEWQIDATNGKRTRVK